MTKSEALALYTDCGHEIAVHGLTHPWLEKLPLPVCVREVIEDRENLEAEYGRTVRGMAYPYGTFNGLVSLQFPQARETSLQRKTFPHIPRRSLSLRQRA